MTTEQRRRVEALKLKRAALRTPLARIAFDNDPANGPIGLRIIVAVESADTCPHGSYRFGKGRSADGGLTLVCAICGEVVA